MNPGWFAVYTKPLQESVALAHLERQGFHCFLPLAMNPYQRRTRGSARSEPLFPRYLLLRAAPDVQNLAVVRSTRGVIGLVRAGVEPIRVPESIIDSLRSRVDPATGLIHLDPPRIAPGDRVRVFDGPMAGAEGILKEHCGEQRSLLLISMLGRNTSVEVDTLLLQRAG